MVSVQLPWPAGSSDGAAVPWSAASPAATRKSSNDRPCWRHDATIVSSRSANRLPASLSEPKLPFRHSTAGRNARSAPLFVGRLDTVHAGTSPQGQPPLRQLPAQARGFVVPVLLRVAQGPILTAAAP